MRFQVVIAAAMAILVAVPLGLLAGSGLVPAQLLVMFAVFSVLAYLMGRRLAGPNERWLPTLILTALIAKLAGASIRHWVLFGVYEGGGDAVAYHEAAIAVADTWRSLTVPAIETVGSGSFGTHFVGWTTGLIYAPFEPSTMGGFWIFSFLAFVGQVLMYAAFRTVSTRAGWRRYAILIFFWPTLLYWPSSIGKEAFLLFLMGLATWGATRLYRRFQFAWLLPIAAATGVIGLVRVHVAALLVGSILLGAILARGPRRDAAAGIRRVALVGLGIAAMFPLVLAVAQQFGVSLQGQVTIEDLDPAFSDIETQTEQGGSAVDDGAIRSPADVPGAILKVLFRPLPNEVANIQTAAASLEGVLLMGLLLWRLPSMVRNAGRVLTWPYLMMSTAYTVGFIFAWSAINNLGILSRQRSLMLPVLFVLVVALGWDDSVADYGEGDLTDRLMGAQDPRDRTPVRA